MKPPKAEAFELRIYRYRRLEAESDEDQERFAR